LFALAAGLLCSAHAEDPKPAPPPASEVDDELLEFLGSVDQGDEDWMDYLAQTDPATVAKSPKKEGEKK
jgi:hypothetical protein